MGKTPRVSNNRGGGALAKWEEGYGMRLRQTLFTPLEGEGRERSERGGVNFSAPKTHPTPARISLSSMLHPPPRGG